jgi:hypothetical protein
VDDKNNPLRDETAAPPQTWQKYIQLWKANVLPLMGWVPNNKDNWVNNWWEHAAKLEFELFQMLMLEQFIHDIILPCQKCSFHREYCKLGVLWMAWMPFSHGQLSADFGSWFVAVLAAHQYVFGSSSTG